LAGRLRFATTSIAKRLNFLVTNAPGPRSNQCCVNSKKIATLPRDIGRGLPSFGQYRLERNELQRPGAKLNPTEVVELLNDISRSAKELANGLLGRLQEYSNSVADPAAPLRQPHLAYLDEFISQAAAGHRAAEVNQDSQHAAHVFFGKQSFLKRLIEVEVAAGEAANRAVVDLLKRKRGQSDPGIYNLVWRCAEIWQSMTGREAGPTRCIPAMTMTLPLSNSFNALCASPMGRNRQESKLKPA
jgi:hypothetical protein